MNLAVFPLLLPMMELRNGWLPEATLFISEGNANSGLRIIEVKATNKM